jgi:hypothetical protein
VRSRPQIFNAVVIPNTVNVVYNFGHIAVVHTEDNLVNAVLLSIKIYNTVLT